jgi:hypothetical protein
MAKMTVKEVPVPKPPITITLDLSIYEAAVIAKLCGRFRSAGEIQKITSNIHMTLMDNDRIKDIYSKILAFDLPNVGKIDIPKEE